MSHTQSERALILFFRLAMAWTFLYAASHQVFVQWSVAGFLDSTKTFHGFYSQFTGPQIAPFLTFDEDPYVIVSDDGRLVWMMDGYTDGDRHC